MRTWRKVAKKEKIAFGGQTDLTVPKPSEQKSML
jgi:hypothetical protein